MRLVVFTLTASLFAPPVLAEAVDDVVVETHESMGRITLRLTTPVRYLRHHPIEDGDSINVSLQALVPEALGSAPVSDEIKRSPGGALVPPFTVRVTLDPLCDPAPHPICIVIRFERATRWRLRLGEDFRSLQIELPMPAATDEVSTPPVTAP